MNCGGQLDKVPTHAGPGQTRVPSSAQQTVQGMPKLMEQRQTSLNVSNAGWSPTGGLKLPTMEITG